MKNTLRLNKESGMNKMNMAKRQLRFKLLQTPYYTPVA